MKLEGTLAKFPLRELIDMITYSSVTGVLNIYADNQSGHLFFRDGRLYHVDFADLEGTDGMAGLLEVSNGTFAFVSDQTTTAETIWGDLEVHLQAAERLAARWRQVRAYVPNLAVIPHLLITPEAAQRLISPQHLQLLAWINGTASLHHIATALSRPPIEIAEAMAQMVIDGAVELRRVPTMARARGEDSSRSDSGLFDRMLRRGAAIAVPTTSPTTVPAAIPAAPSPLPSADDPILKLLRGA